MITTTTVEWSAPTGPVWFVWHGGGNYSVGYLPDDLETAGSVADVIEVCEDRKANRDGRTPCVDVSSCAHVFYADPTGNQDPYPDLSIELVGGEYVTSPA